MNQQKQEPEKKHLVQMENRKRLHVEGITDVDAYNEHLINARTVMGDMGIEGNNLHIVSLTLEKGIMEVDGDISGIYYAAPQTVHEGGGFFSRLFR